MKRLLFILFVLSSFSLAYYCKPPEDIEERENMYKDNAKDDKEYSRIKSNLILNINWGSYWINNYSSLEDKTACDIKHRVYQEKIKELGVPTSLTQEEKLRRTVANKYSVEKDKEIRRLKNRNK